MNLQDYVKVLRARWVTICVTVLISVLGAATYIFVTTPLYEASTRLFVSTTSGGSLAETYQGNRFSQERVISYGELLMGRTVALRTIDKLGLDMTAEQLQANVKAVSKPDTVLISVSVVDESPVRARDIANTLSDEFVTMVRELETPEDGSPPDSRVVVEQRATIPTDPVVPKPLRTLAIGTLLGLLVGVGLALLRDTLDNTVKSREAVEEITGTGLVGTVPLDKERRKQPAITFDGNHTATAEAFRKLRTNLQFLSVDNPPHVFVVTSSIPGEGKSTTAINIALALAESEKSVVLVDGDLRRPTTHKYLELIGQVGLSTVLSGQTTLDESLQTTRFPGLTVLASGTIPPNPSELLSSQSARKLITELRERFDYVIIDSSPLLAVTDAALLAVGADGVLMMTRFGQTKREQLTHAIESLHTVGAPLLGAVFTMAPTRGGSPYSYNYVYYGSDTTSANAQAPQPADSEPTVGAGEPPERKDVDTNAIPSSKSGD